MTTTTIESPVPPTSTYDSWEAQFAQLKARYPKVREPILVALHILTQDPDISLDDAKAQAALRGVRITAASVNAAQRLLSRQAGAPAATSRAAPTQTAGTAPAKTRRQRRPRAPKPSLDTESLIRGVVAKIEDQGAAEAERLREAIRKAIAVLQTAAGDGVA